MSCDVCLMSCDVCLMSDVANHIRTYVVGSLLDSHDGEAYIAARTAETLSHLSVCVQGDEVRVCHQRY